MAGRLGAVATKAQNALAGRCALITGASQGLGLSLARRCASYGMDLLLIALPGSGIERVAEELAADWGVQASSLEVDLIAEGGPEAVQSWVEELGAPLALLINNAGVSYTCRFEESTLAQNETCILLNALAVVKLTHLLLPLLRRATPAYLLNVASLAAFFPMPLKPVYAPTKAFVVQFSLALRQDLIGSGVSVSVLCPSGMRTTAMATGPIDKGSWLVRASCLGPNQVAAFALEQMLRGADVIIPGWLNRLALLAGNVAPRWLLYRFLAGVWHKPPPGASAPSEPDPYYREHRP